MDLSTIGIMSTGEMGSSIARTVKANGLEPITTLEGRSDRTRENARAAGVEDVPIEELVARADVVFSVVVSAAVHDVAERVAEAARAADETVLLADMNPISPAKARALAAEFEPDLDLVDGCIIGPASDLSRAYFEFSGPRAADVAAVGEHGLNAEVLGEDVGQASGMKLCYAGMTKGLSALGMDLLLGAAALGIGEEVADLYADRMDGIMPFLDRRLPGNPKRAERRAQEMDELAVMFEDEGVDPRLAQAGAERLHWLGSLGLDTDDAEDAVETARRVSEATE